MARRGEARLGKARNFETTRLTNDQEPVFVDLVTATIKGAAMKKTFGLILFIILTAGSGAGLTLLCLPESEGQAALRKQQANALWLSDRIGEILYENADLMQRFSHYTDTHSPGVEVLLCPECTAAADAQSSLSTDGPEVELPVIEAADELSENLARHLFAVRAHRETLRHTLDRFRNP